jgi:hypothetical protein
MTTYPAVGKLQSMAGGNVHLTRLAALVIAFIGCLIVWLIADPIGGANLKVTDFNDNVVGVNGWGVLTSIATYGIAAWIVVWLIERFTSRPRQIWLIVGTVVLLLSAIPVFSGSENTATTITLLIMHVVAGAVIIPVFADTIRKR